MVNGNIKLMKRDKIKTVYVTQENFIIVVYKNQVVSAF